MNGGRREREKGETERKSGCYHSQDQGAVSMSMQWGWGCWLPAHQPVQFLERHGFTGAAPAMMGDQTHSEWVLEQDIQNSGWGHDEERWRTGSEVGRVGCRDTERQDKREGEQELERQARVRAKGTNKMGWGGPGQRSERTSK